MDKRKSTLSQIKKTIEKRHDSFISNQRAMINSLQDVRKNRITLDRVATRDEQVTPSSQQIQQKSWLK